MSQNSLLQPLGNQIGCAPKVVVGVLKVDVKSYMLYTTARNRMIDQYRKPKMASLEALAAESDSEDDAFELPESLLHEASTPESENLRILFWEQLQAALAELPQEQRQVFVWHELEGLPFQQIAALTGENLNTLLSRKRYAVLHLRQRFQRLHDEFLS